MKNNKYRFTPTEWEIIEHRLEAGDGLFEAVCEYAEDQDLRVSRDTVWDTCQDLLSRGPELEIKSKLEHALLQAAIEGGGFMVIAEEVNAGPGNKPHQSEISHGKYIAYCRAANSIERKTGHG